MTGKLEKVILIGSNVKAYDGREDRVSDFLGNVFGKKTSKFYHKVAEEATKTAEQFKAEDVLAFYQNLNNAFEEYGGIKVVGVNMKMDVATTDNFDTLENHLKEKIWPRSKLYFQTMKGDINGEVEFGSDALLLENFMEEFVGEPKKAAANFAKTVGGNLVMVINPAVGLSYLFYEGKKIYNKSKPSALYTITLESTKNNRTSEDMLTYKKAIDKIKDFQN